MTAKNGFVELEDVSFSYGNQLILNKVRLSLERGTSYALIGKSGVGKSTLLNLIAGFITPSQGAIYVSGNELKAPIKRIAYLFQDLGLFPWQTVAQAITMPLRLQQGSDNSGIQEAVTLLLKEMELDHLSNKYPSELSGGEKQRVALARTLIGRPELIMMDEPTSSLDAMTKESIQQLVLKYQQKRKATLLFITHDIEEAVLLGEKIILLNTEGTLEILDNLFYGVDNAKEQLGFYEKCIQIRKFLKLEN
ncbi:MAG: transporter ATP-binding protein [Herbinix sp.]|jgi:NitT/TauT family transport system ATP-binding protein|nr:transporter ATP-binding protein [Herbinix sp.]